VSVFEGTQDSPLTTGHFAAFTGNPFDTQQWLESAPVESIPTVVTLDAAGIAYVNSVIGSTAKFCLREYEHDVSDVSPLINTDSRNGMIFSDYFVEAARPQLLLWL